jgi:hypothetical protein
MLGALPEVGRRRHPVRLTTQGSENTRREAGDGVAVASLCYTFTPTPPIASVVLLFEDRSRRNELPARGPRPAQMGRSAYGD